MSAQTTTWPSSSTNGVIAVDTSALIAVLLVEAEQEIIVRRLAQAQQVFMSAANLLEARIVLHQRRGATHADLAAFMKKANITVIAPDEDQIDCATQAFLIYGKGNGHKAQLNYGDLFSYALAKTRNIPLLYKGDDFAQTDIRSALS